MDWKEFKKCNKGRTFKSIMEYEIKARLFSFFPDGDEEKNEVIEDINFNWDDYDNWEQISYEVFLGIHGLVMCLVKEHRLYKLYFGDK